MRCSMPEWRQSRGGCALLVLLAACGSYSSLRAADEVMVQSTTGPGLAFARYIAGLEVAKAWTVETVEVNASLPKLAMNGRMRAVRRLAPAGKADYQILELVGDQTVRQQVIARYLSAEERAASIPASSVAITPANYKFHYQGVEKMSGSVIYVFQITPRKKREGLLKGELWLDGDSGSAVRQSGYLVKSPSIFVKRVDVTRESPLRSGIGEERVTRLSIDTRLVGRAELTILERPYDFGELEQ